MSKRCGGTKLTVENGYDLFTPTLRERVIYFLVDDVHALGPHRSRYRVRRKYESVWPTNGRAWQNPGLRQ